MPWKIYRTGDKFCVHKLDGEQQGERVACHDSESGAQAQLRALYASESKKSLAIYKQADGAYRWVGWVSNHFRDRDRPAEILSGKAHAEFVQWADKTGNYPELWLWHVPGSRVGKADWLEFADGFLLSSGTFDKDKADVAERLAASDEPLTMSHGFVRVKHDPEKVVTDLYRSFEESITPSGVEANPWTSFVAKEVQMPLSDAKKSFLAKYLPADTIAQLEEKTTELRKAAEAAGVDWKDVEGADAPPPADTPIVAPPAAATDNTATLADQLTEAVVTRIVERLAIKDLSEVVATLTQRTEELSALKSKIEGLEAVVKGLKQTDDEKVAAVLAPKAAEALMLSWAGKAASKSAATLVDDSKPADKALSNQKPFLAQIAEIAAGQAARMGS